MGFNEKVHAFIAARYYVRLTQQFGERGRQTFIHATQYYGEQRGRRMAQRAIRDGEPLTYETYCYYGEWLKTDECKQMGLAGNKEVLTRSPDVTLRMTACPWHAQFQEMGLIDGGDTYCAHLDNSICRGFNPYINYEVVQTQHKSDCCIHIIHGASLTPEAGLDRKPGYQKDFAYHCAHSFWSYREIAQAVFGEEGADLAGDVLNDFRKEYGEEMADQLLAYRGTNFNVTDM